MKTYIAFLRGINISGKNKISMSDLKLGFEEIGYSNVSTYLNSGNVLFESEKMNIMLIRQDIESMIFDRFGFRIPVFIIEKDKLDEILRNAPEWWGTDNKEKYDNLIFVLSDDTAVKMADSIGPISEGMELMEIYENVIFWTFDRKTYQKCNWWKKTAGTGIAEKITIRTAGTVRKMCK